METRPRAWECKRCYHVWTNRKDHEPYYCPKCKSYLWREPKEGTDVNAYIDKLAQ